MNHRLCSWFLNPLFLELIIFKNQILKKPCWFKPILVFICSSENVGEAKREWGKIKSKQSDTPGPSRFSHNKDVCLLMDEYLYHQKSTEATWQGSKWLQSDLFCCLLLWLLQKPLTPTYLSEIRDKLFTTCVELIPTSITLSIVSYKANNKNQWVL